MARAWKGWGKSKSGNRWIGRSLGAVTTATALIVASGVGSAEPAPTAASAPGPGLPPLVSTTNWKPRYLALKHWTLGVSDLRVQAASGLTVPFWTTTVKSPLDKKTYTTSMVGSSPFAATKTNAVVSYVPLIGRLHFAGGFILDPTKPGNCDPVPPATRFFASPMFAPATFVSNGVNVSAGVAGGAQFASAFQRANYYALIKGTQFGMTLKASAKPLVVDITIPATAGQAIAMEAHCPKQNKFVTFGEAEISFYDAIVQKVIATHSKPNQLPILLTYNFVMTAPGAPPCCVLGYHSAVSSAAGTRTYSVGSYIDPGIFSGVDDDVVWSHEIGEWMDDPFVQAAVTGGGSDDLTPAWGNTGQVTGCQNNLEVGDPLSGTEWSMKGAGGFLYHFQDLAFRDWFYRTPSNGTGKKYSLVGGFTTAQGKCSAAPVHGLAGAG